MAKLSASIYKKLQKKTQELQECKDVNMRISSIRELHLDVIPILQKAYNKFYISGGTGDPAGYLYNGQSADAHYETGESRILLLKKSIEDWNDSAAKLCSKLRELIKTKEAEKKSLETQYKQALANEAQQK